MSEAGFQAFNRVFSASAELLNAGALAFLFFPFLPKEKHRWRKLIVVLLAYLLPCFLCGRVTTLPRSFGLLVALLLVALAGVLEMERPLVFLLTILYWNARISSGLIVESLYFIAERSLPFPFEPLEAVYFRAIALVIAFLISHMTLLFLMLYALRRRVRSREMSLHRRELCYLSLVPTAGILFGQMISKLLIEFQDGVLLQLYQRHPIFLAVVPLMALLFYLGAYIAIAFQQGMSALREEQQTYFAERQQTQAIRSRLRETEQFYTQIRSLKHELRGHLTNLRGLVRSGEYASLEDYISRMDESIGDFELILQTGNPVTDIIINDKERVCREQGICFRMDFHYPVRGEYDAFDVGIILQNLLQNALEACGKITDGEKYITLTGKQKGRFFLIDVKNSFSGQVVFGSDGLPVTGKKDLLAHGIGLTNVRREVEKYMGELELKAEQQEFSATVLLQERSSL